MRYHVERDFRRYLECGILAYGFARAYCADCGRDFLVAFSCKGRGVCPSCNARRMAQTAAHTIAASSMRCSTLTRVSFASASCPASARPDIAAIQTRVSRHRIAALVPPPRVHRHRYHGVLAPNSPLRAKVIALAEETTVETASSTETDQADGPDSLSRSPARYLWATLIARLFEIFPLTCPHCGAEMKIIAFVTETPSVRAILAHIGEPTRPPAIAPARAPPAFDDPPVELEPDYDPLAQPEPAMEFDQRIHW